MIVHDLFVDSAPQTRRRYDPVLLFSLLLLVAIGIGMLWSASWYRAEVRFGDPLHFVTRQAQWIAIGLVLMVGTLFVPLETIRRYIPVLVIGSLLLALLPFVPGLGERYLGARRWVTIPFVNVSVQPSEVMKPVLILYLAHIFSRRVGAFDEPIHSLAPPAIVAALFAMVVLAQNDFSTAVFLVALALALFFAAGVPLRYFFSMFAVLAPTLFLLLFTREHRVARVITFLRPEFDPVGSGFQVLASRRALAAGGLWGAGIGQSTRKLGGLPIVEADFLFAVLGEELGFIGVFMVVALFGLFVGRAIWLAWQDDDWFRSLVTFGIAVSIALQALLNIAVVAGVVPATGVPLPFFSAGGSSLLVTFVMCGLLLNATSGARSG